MVSDAAPLDTLECFECGRTWTRPAEWGSGFKRSAKCSDCRRKQRELEWAGICPPLYQDTDPSRLPQEAFRQIMGWEYGPTGLLLIGETGRGKSRAAWLLLKHLYLKHGIAPQVYDCIGFAHEVAVQFSTDDQRTGMAWAKKVAATKLLFFDDLGKLKFTERVETELFGVIERRCAAKLPIIATTNDSGDSLAARMTENRGPALIRRLREFCRVVQF